MNTTAEQFTISQMAELTGLSVHTLRYYEKIGLIRGVDRADNTHRRYSENDVGWVEFLIKLRATGMPIHDMQRYAELQRQGDASLPERVAMLDDLRRAAEAHIAEIQQHLGLIRYKIDFYSNLIRENGPDECAAIIEPAHALPVD